MKKRLNRIELFKIVNYLNSNWEMLQKEQFPQTILEQKIQQETQVDVKYEIVGRICKDLGKDILEITGKSRRRSVSGHSSDRVRLLASQVAALVAELQRCYKLLGEEFDPSGNINPAVIRSIVGGKNLSSYRAEKEAVVEE
jgi:hypothetical protein